MLHSLNSNAPNEPPPGELHIVPERVHRLEVGAICHLSSSMPSISRRSCRVFHALYRLLTKMLQVPLDRLRHLLYLIKVNWFGSIRKASFPPLELQHGGGKGGCPPSFLLTFQPTTPCHQLTKVDVSHIDDPGAHTAHRSYANQITFSGKREDPPPRFLSNLRYTFLTLIDLGAGPNKMPAKSTARTL